MILWYLWVKGMKRSQHEAEGTLSCHATAMPLTRLFAWTTREDWHKTLYLGVHLSSFWVASRHGQGANQVLEASRSQNTYPWLICPKIGQERRRFLSGITPHFVAHFNPWWKIWKVTKWLGKANFIPKVNSNKKMIGTFDKTVCQGDCEFKRVLKMFRLYCRSCDFKSLKDSRLTARFLWQQTFRYFYRYTELDLSFPFTMIAIFSLPASSNCSPASEVRWHLFEMANPEVGRETCCNFRWSNCNVPPESLWSKGVRWFNHLLNCFEMFPRTRFMSTCAICIWCSKICSRQCLSQTFDESLLAFFNLNPCMNCKDLTSCDNVYKGLTSTGALNMLQHDQRRPELALEQVERRIRLSILCRWK